MMTVDSHQKPVTQQATEPWVHQKGQDDLLLSPLSGSLVQRGGGKDDQLQKIVEATGPSSWLHCGLKNLMMMVDCHWKVKLDNRLGDIDAKGV